MLLRCESLELPCLSRVIHVALVASVNRPHVRFASESDRIAAQQRNDAQCRLCSLIPGFGVKLSAIIPCRAHCSLRGRGLPSMMA
jgi:hypothetical protein